MKILLGVVTAVFILGALVWALMNFSKGDDMPSIVPRQSNSSNSSITTQTTQTNFESEKMTVIATGLDTPWAITFLPDKSMLVTERAGRVRLIDSSGKLQSEPVATLPVREVSESGLMGIAAHPDFTQNNYVYLYYTYATSGSNVLNKVVRMTYGGGR